MKKSEKLKMEKKNTVNQHINPSRRNFLIDSFKTLTAGFLTFTIFDINKIFAIDPSFVSDVQKVINLSDYPALGKVGGYAMITKNVIVIRTGQNNFIAVRTICTHKKCDVEYNGKEFECPCHGSKFNRSGKVLNGPATKSLTSYKTTFNADNNTLTVNM